MRVSFSKLVHHWFASGLVMLIASKNLGAVSAASISLLPDQRARLGSLISTNEEAKNYFQEYQREADASLEAPGIPVVTLSTSGKLADDPEKAATKKALGDMKRLEALGYTYAVSSNQAYAFAAKKIILRWAQVCQPTGSPIDETRLEPLFVAYDLTREVFDAADRQTVEDWLRVIAQAEIEHAKSGAMTSNNNWNSHRLKIIGLIGFALDDHDLINRAIDGFKRQVATNLEPDGSSLDFHERDALFYHCFDLEPLLSLAIAAKLNGFDLYSYQSPNGSSVSNSVHFLLPYCAGTKTHPEWVHSQVKFDHERSAAGEKKFKVGALFNPKEAREVLSLASFFDPGLKTAFPHESKTFWDWQSLLNYARNPA